MAMRGVTERVSMKAWSTSLGLTWVEREGAQQALVRHVLWHHTSVTGSAHGRRAHDVGESEGDATYICGKHMRQT